MLTGLFKYGDIKAGLGLDTEHNERMKAIKKVSASATVGKMLEQEERSRLASAYLGRLSPVDVELAGRLLQEGVKPRLTAHEKFIGSSGGSTAASMQAQQALSQLLATGQIPGM